MQLNNISITMSGKFPNCIDTVQLPPKKNAYVLEILFGGQYGCYEHALTFMGSTSQIPVLSLP